MDLSATQFTPKRKVVRFEDVPVTTRDGATINVRVHIPPAVHNKPLPVVYYSASLRAPSAAPVADLACARCPR